MVRVTLVLWMATPAAYRYTEARMSRMAVEMLTDIEKDTIDWDPNFDETKKEPSVLPCRFPNLLVNGSQGIAVGMATNIPPHNLSEVIDGCIAYIDDPDIDLPGLMEYIKGPDFPLPASSWAAAASAPPTPPAGARSPCGPRHHRGDQERPYPDHHYGNSVYGQQGPPHREHGRPCQGEAH